MGPASELAMLATLFCMMLAVALGLKPSDFAFIKRAPRLYLAGVFGQFLILPLLTLALCAVLEPDPAVALGMLLISCCPGGNVSNILVMFARGNTALSVSLTATSSVFAAFITPVAILFWTAQYRPTAAMLDDINLDVIAFLLQTASVLALPLAIGMFARRHWPEYSECARKPLVLLASLALAAIIVMTAFKAGDLIISVGSTIIGIVALHNALAYASGYAIGLLVRADRSSRRALTYEIGIQNAGLGIVIIMAHFNGIGAAAAIAGLWGAWHIIAGAMLMCLFRLRDKLSMYSV